MTFDAPAADTFDAADFAGGAIRAFDRGVGAFKRREPVNFEQWARENFYLSAESSYVEQSWTPWPFQRAIMSILSNDDVREVNIKKSARVGFTKILLAFIGYTAHHTKRNQCIWQPTDDDAVDFVKSELEPMLRDVEVMREVFPKYLARHKDNTLDQKRFLGSLLRIKGAKAAKNFRRISIDVAMLDETDAMDNDVEKEGDPITLAFKRTEGATFPKRILGSTPKLKGFSLIDGRYAEADVRMSFQAPCPECGKRHALTFGGKDVSHGFKWLDRRPDTVRHLCPHCGCLITQAQWLAVAEQGVFVSDDGGVWLHPDGRFTDPEGEPVPTPAHVGLHVWTAYSPVVSWHGIVTDFLSAIRAKEEGDNTKLQAFTNTTLGAVWDGEVEHTDADEYKARAEPFPLRVMPPGCLLLLAGGDTQGNRIEIGVWGYGRGGEMWTIDHRVFFGNPALPQIWDEVEEFLRATQYPHARGIPQRIQALALDSGGHHSDEVYAFAHRCRSIGVYAVKGVSHRERSIDQGSSNVEYRWNGRISRHGAKVWSVGTNLAKDRFQARLEVAVPGPGYVHLSQECSDEWFRQLASEMRAARRTATGNETRWVKVRTRNEVRDCLTYATWLEERLDLWHPRRVRFWDNLEATVQPEADLFTRVAPLPEYETRLLANAPKPGQVAVEPVAVEKHATQPATVAPKPRPPARPTLNRTW